MNEKGLTLIEVLASIVILSIIGVSLLTFFVQSARSNNLSKTMMDATYVAQSYIEDINNLNKSSSTPTNITVLGDKITNTGFVIDTSPSTGCSSCYKKNLMGNNRFVHVKLTNQSDSLGKVLVKVFTGTKEEAQMEMLISWKK
ncbi:type II secretion system protein [Neobacillus sp. 179-J 1A1 HS]|uniref:type IV pilus modification PilV family protein n=1 Tax=Neobacillus driksii TaxID=3035913 RepID=UPI0035BC9677